MQMAGKKLLSKWQEKKRTDLMSSVSEAKDTIWIITVCAEQFACQSIYEATFESYPPYLQK